MVIEDVAKGSTAAQLGVQPGGILVALNENPLTGMGRSQVVRLVRLPRTWGTAGVHSGCLFVPSASPLTTHSPTTSTTPTSPRHLLLPRPPPPLSPLLAALAHLSAHSETSTRLTCRLARVSALSRCTCSRVRHCSSTTRTAPLDPLRATTRQRRKRRAHASGARPSRSRRTYAGLSKTEEPCALRSPFPDAPQPCLLCRPLDLRASSLPSPPFGTMHAEPPRQAHDSARASDRQPGRTRSPSRQSGRRGRGHGGSCRRRRGEERAGR